MTDAHAEALGRRGPDDHTFWAMLEPTEQTMMRQIGSVRRFGAGESLCRQGDGSRDVYVLLAGSIEIVADVATGYESVLAVRGPGDIVGEFAAIDGRPRSAMVRALDQVETVVLPAQRFAALCQSRPELAWVVLQVVVQRLREISQQQAEHGGSLAKQRLVTLLVELAQRYGVTEDDSATGEGSVTISIPLTQQSMAGLIAASRESVVRALADLRRQKLIKTGRRRVTILRLEALKRLAS